MMHWLDCHNQKVAINSLGSKWRAVMSGVPQEPIIGPVLFDIFLQYCFLQLETNRKFQIKSGDSKIMLSVSYI